MLFRSYICSSVCYSPKTPLRFITNSRLIIRTFGERAWCSQQEKRYFQKIVLKISCIKFSKNYVSVYYSCVIHFRILGISGERN